MDIQLIKKLIQLENDNNVGELKIKEGDFKIEITHKDFVKQQNITATTSVPSSTVVATPTMVESNNTTPKANESVVADNVKTIKSPMIGTFYRSSDPDKEPFVKVGDKIKVGDVLCIIESMKLFNEIKSDVSGKIVKVMADNAQAVEYDQAIFLIE